MLKLMCYSAPYVHVWLFMFLSAAKMVPQGHPGKSISGNFLVLSDFFSMMLGR